MIKKMESLIGKFVWKGRILRVALEELKNDYLEGGLKLPCIATMNDSLIVSQCLKLIKSADLKSLAHLRYWLGPILEDIVPAQSQVLMAVDTPEYFMFIGEKLQQFR